MKVLIVLTFLCSKENLLTRYFQVIHRRGWLTGQGEELSGHAWDYCSSETGQLGSQPEDACQAHQSISCGTPRTRWQ